MLKKQSYVLNYDECELIFMYLAEQGYSWKLSAFISERLLANNDNPCNTPFKKNMIVIDRENKFVYNRDASFDINMAMLKCCTHPLGDDYKCFLEDEKIYAEFYKYRSELSSKLLKDTNYLDFALNCELEKYSFTSEEKQNLFWRLIKGKTGRGSEFIDCLTEEFINNGYMMVNDIIVKAFGFWMKQGNTDLSQYYLYRI